MGDFLFLGKEVVPLRLLLQVIRRVFDKSTLTLNVRFESEVSYAVMRMDATIAPDSN